MKIEKILNLINNFDSIDVSVYKDDDKNVESMIGHEMYDCMPIFNKKGKLVRRKVGSEFEYNKYIALVIENDMPDRCIGKFRIIREI